jgi:thioesterase domain-containing protein
VDRLAALAAWCEDTGLFPRGSAIVHLQRALDVRDAHHRAHLHHRPGRFSGRTLIVRAAVQIPAVRALLAHDPTGGWGELVRAPALHTLPGDHFSLLQPPHVTAVAALVHQTTVNKEPHE